MKNGLFVGVVIASMFFMCCNRREQTVLFLSTNDIHAKIEQFPRLAEAVRQARDTATVVLVDAGDRWTGNAYVDLAREPRRPIVDLMNRLGYDVATFGNHEFDVKQGELGHLLGLFDFPVLGANVLSDTAAIPQPPAYAILERDGIRIGFVGVVTNYDTNNHPAGLDANFEGLVFPDPQYTAAAYGWLRDSVDMLVLLSHMGDERDAEFASKWGMYDLIVGGHSHQEIDTVVNGTQITQTGKYLRNIGATEVRFRRGEIAGIDYRNISLADYPADTLYGRLVAGYYDNPELTRSIGTLAETADKVGLANWFARSIAERTASQIGFYHIGGVRLDSLSGSVSTAQVYDLEPFNSTVATMRMTPEQMRKLIMTKFNDKVNLDESHRIDLYSTTPYRIIVGEDGDALDVQFPQLEAGVRYRVAIGNYAFENYADFEYEDGDDTEILLTEIFIDDLRKNSPLVPDNTLRQQIAAR